MRSSITVETEPLHYTLPPVSEKDGRDSSHLLEDQMASPADFSSSLRAIWLTALAGTATWYLLWKVAVLVWSRH